MDIEHFRKFRKLIVSGPARSGTKIAMKIIAKELGYIGVPEEMIGMINTSSAKILVDKCTDFVLQTPFCFMELDNIADDDTLVIIMRRDVNDIAISRTHKKKDTQTEKYIDIASFYYEVWEKIIKGRIRNIFELEYESLSGHSMWLDREQRKGLAFLQTEYNERRSDEVTFLNDFLGKNGFSKKEIMEYIENRKTRSMKNRLSPWS